MVARIQIKRLFRLGRLCATPAALKELTKAGLHPLRLVNRHVTGDFGEVCKADALANLEAIRDGTRILSSYTLPTNVVVWIITEADRTTTILLLPEDY